MRIGVILPGFSADASDWCIPALRDFVETLARSDDVWVLALRYPFARHDYTVFGASVRALAGGQRSGLGSGTLWSDALRSIAAVHRHQPFDVLHAFWADEAGAIATIAGRLLAVPVIVSLAGGELVGFRDIAYGSQITRTGRFKVRLALKLATRVTAGSEYMHRLALPLVRRRLDPVVVAPLGVDVERFHPPPSGDDYRSTSLSRRTGDETPRLIHVASLVPVKDQATLLRAAAFAREAGASFILDIVGSGPLEQRLKRLSSELALDQVARFHGSKPHDELPSWYRASDLFVLSSRHEAQCLAVLEAAACGVPTVGTAVGVVPELASTSAAPLGVGDSEALGTSIASTIMGTASHRPALEDRRRAIEGTFGRSTTASSFRQLYVDAILTHNR